MERLLSPRRVRWLLVVLAVAPFLIAAAIGLRRTGFWQTLEPGRVRPLAAGDQEIAWLAPATSGETWERLVKAVRLLSSEYKSVHGGDELRLDAERAFLPLTADVPEVGLSFGGGTLWIRWYKLSGSTNSEHWMRALERRPVPPLAIVGGETTDRALALADLLTRTKKMWHGSPPLLLITTATAERYLPADRPGLKDEHERWPRLMGVYPERTFRFCFTNSRMVESVLDFLQQNPQVWPRYGTVRASPSPFFLFTLTWLDDGYSKDLALIFQQLHARNIRDRFGDEEPVPADENFIEYSVGDYYRPNPREEIAVTLYLDQVRPTDPYPPLALPFPLPAHIGILAAINQVPHPDRRQLLVLPTGTQRARRLLRTLCSRAPKEVRNVVVANGDAISFNNVYRDRDLAWNVQDLPVPLVFFSHRSPIDPAAGFGLKREDKTDRSSTQDLLLFRDIVEALVVAAFDEGQLASDSEAVLAKLRHSVWRDGHVFRGSESAKETPFFDAEGNRTPMTGEHVVWLQPHFKGARILPDAELSVWSAGGSVTKTTWQRVGDAMTLDYDRPGMAGSVHEAR
jgi:hypothetical protein